MSKRRKFSAEFKRGAVEQASQPGVSCAQVARELGIRDNLLTRWKREARSQGKVAFGGTGTPRDEELARLDAHIGQMGELLEAREPMGRKMDFLVQEMNREINTIGSKTSELQMTRLVLDAKNALEKMREQIQNAE